MRELYPKGFLQEFSRQRSSIEFIVLNVSLNEFKQVLSFKSYIISFYSVVQKNFFSPPNTSGNKPIAKQLLQPFPYILCGEFFMRSEFYRETEKKYQFFTVSRKFRAVPSDVCGGSTFKKNA